MLEDVRIRVMLAYVGAVGVLTLLLSVY